MEIRNEEHAREMIKTIRSIRVFRKAGSLGPDILPAGSGSILGEIPIRAIVFSLFIMLILQ